MPIKILLTLFIFSAGCSVHKGAIVAPLNVSGAKEVPIAIREGEARSFTVLGIFGPFGNDSVSRAILNAKDGTDADTMGNVFVESSVTAYPFIFLPIVIVRKTAIYGTLVKYVDESGKRIIPEEVKAVEEEATIGEAPKEKQVISMEPKAISELRNFFSSLKIGARVVITTTKGKEIKGTYHGLREPHFDTAWITTAFGTYSLYLDQIFDAKERDLK